MTRPIRIGFAIAAWLAIAVINSGFVYANFYEKYPTLHSARHNREDGAFAVGWSLFPPAWIITPFETGFYYDGWMFPGSDRP